VFLLPYLRKFQE